jgi:hypothetical protein
VILRILVLMSVVSVFPAGCAERYTGDFCGVAEPIRPSRTGLAAMTEREVLATLRHNQLGEQLCGWKPASE